MIARIKNFWLEVELPHMLRAVTLGDLESLYRQAKTDPRTTPRELACFEAEIERRADLARALIYGAAGIERAPG